MRRQRLLQAILTIPAKPDANRDGLVCDSSGRYQIAVMPLQKFNRHSRPIHGKMDGHNFRRD
jgi:hypothetical protein